MKLLKTQHRDCQCLPAISSC